jgi:CcmD family protein
MVIGSPLPFTYGAPYVAAAFLVFLALILLYVAIMAGKLSRIERELGDLEELAQRRREAGEL